MIRPFGAVVKLFDRILRKLSPERYVLWNLWLLSRAKRRKQPIYDDTGNELDPFWEEAEWRDWLHEIRDRRLVKTGESIEVYLDEIPCPEDDENPLLSHYRIGTWGNKLLAGESRIALRKKIRERAPIHRKERREIWDLRIRGFAAVITGLVSLVGALTGLIAVWTKK